MRIDRNKMLIAMARAKLNRSDLAEKAGLTVPIVANTLNRGTCKPATAGSIAEALGVDVTEILADN